MRIRAGWNFRKGQVNVGIIGPNGVISWLDTPGRVRAFDASAVAAFLLPIAELQIMSTNHDHTSLAMIYPPV
jgi:hypothetical protein